jgi:hypothetical protein
VRKVCRRRRGREGGRAARRVEGEREDREGSFMMVPAVLGLPQGLPLCLPYLWLGKREGTRGRVGLLCICRVVLFLMLLIVESVCSVVVVALGHSWRAAASR